MIQILFQNNETQQIFDITPVVSTFEWHTVRRGSPGSVTLTLKTDIALPHGSAIQVKDGAKKIFFGYIFKVNKQKDKQRQVVCFDQIKYLLRNATYIFKNKNIREIITAIAKDFELETGAMDAPNDVLPTLLKEDKMVLDTINDAFDEVLLKTGHLMVLWDDYGKLRINVPQNLMISTVLADGSIISDYEYSGSIEDSANIVKIVRNNATTGKRESYIFQDSLNIKKWGKLQHFVTVDENVNEAQIKTRGDLLIKLKNRVYETISLSFSVGNFDFRAGYSVYVDVKDIGVKGWYVLDDVKHNVSSGSHTMEVKLFLPTEGG